MSGNKILNIEKKIKKKFVMGITLVPNTYNNWPPLREIN